MDIKYKIAKLKSKLGKRNAMLEYYKSKGLKIGSNCNICTTLPNNESFLIEIGDNTVVSYKVDFITHDASYGAIINKKYVDLYGKIKIGNNCFIGACSILMYGIELGDNTVVAAGSVVTKSFKDGNVVIGGNPAKIICTTDKFLEKYKDSLIDTNGLDFKGKKNKVLSSKRLIEK